MLPGQRRCAGDLSGTGRRLSYPGGIFGDEIDRIAETDPLTGQVHALLEHIAIFPASHYVVPQEKINAACKNIEKELEERIRYFKSEDKLLEAQRISERTNFDIEMLRETGFVPGLKTIPATWQGWNRGQCRIH